MLMQLRLREKRTNPPTFLELLRETCTEEEYEASKEKLNQSVCTIHAKLQVENKQSQIQSLRAEIKEVKSMFAALSTHPHSDPVERNNKPPLNMEIATETSLNLEVAALKRNSETDTMENELKNVPSGFNYVFHHCNEWEHPKQTYNQGSRALLLLLWGKWSHGSECRNSENKSKLIQRLKEALKEAKSNNSTHW